MAADTATKRHAAMQLGQPWRQSQPIPSGAVGDVPRATLLYFYLAGGDLNLLTVYDSFDIQWQENDAIVFKLLDVDTFDVQIRP
jgi:hypothetical protein